MTQDLGALSGSRASAEPSSTVSALTGFDPARVADALDEAVYVIRNCAGLSEWHKRHSSRPFDHEDFCVWADHWLLMHPVVTVIAALHDRDVLLRADAIATEAGTAATVEQGAVHEGAGRNGIAQGPSQ